MLFNQLVKSKRDNLERYIFYRGLGYSVEASELLACVTYGSEELAYRMESLQGNDALVRLHSWLEEQDYRDPQTALQKYFDDGHWPLEPEGRIEFDSGNYSLKTPSNSGRHIIRPKLRKPSGRGIMPKAKRARTEITRSRIAGSFFDNALATPRRSVSTPSEGQCDSIEPELIAYDAYEPIEEKSAKGVFTAPTSTFRMTTSTASMGILFNQLRSGRRINLDQVRIEEILNYFDYEASARRTSLRSPRSFCKRARTRSCCSSMCRAARSSGSTRTSSCCWTSPGACSVTPQSHRPRSRRS